MKFRFSKTAEELRRLMDLRRSSATTPTKNKKKYNRKVKHPKKDLDQPSQLRGQSTRFLPDWPQVRLLPRALSEALLYNNLHNFLYNNLYDETVIRPLIRAQFNTLKPSVVYERVKHLVSLSTGAKIFLPLIVLLFICQAPCLTIWSNT